MKHSILPFFLLALLSVLIFSFSHDDHLIDWNASRKLVWSDFKGKPDPNSSNAALTSSSIKAEFGFSQKEGLTHSIKCVFNKTLSWGRVKNDYILNHEQGHFDIAEIHARMLHKELGKYKFNPKTANQDVNDIYSAVMKQHVESQRLYDLQTNHSLDTAHQSEWDKKISMLLKAHEQFADYQ